MGCCKGGRGIAVDGESRDGTHSPDGTEQNDAVTGEPGLASIDGEDSQY